MRSLGYHHARARVVDVPMAGPAARAPPTRVISREEGLLLHWVTIRDMCDLMRIGPSYLPQNGVFGLTNERSEL